MANTDIYAWHVIFDDDTTLNEFDDNPDGRGFADVEKVDKKVKALELWGQADTPSHRVDIPKGAVPVFFRRRTIELEPSGNQSRSTVHCIGFRYMHDACYLFIHENGYTLLTNDFNAV